MLATVYSIDTKAAIKRDECCTALTLTGHPRTAFLNNTYYTSLMGLVGISGNPRKVNNSIMQLALDNTPCIVLDCVTAADAHKFFAHTTEDALENAWVIEIELLYKLRDALKIVPQWMTEKKCNKLFITCNRHLFHYQDENENRNVYAHIWDLLLQLGWKYDIVVALTPHSVQYAFALMRCEKIIDCGDL